jgi:ATP-dependent exoDNAse (exonuclease V) beta subunit
MSHELWSEIASTEIRRHEIPYSAKLAGGNVDMGMIDLLYKTERGWRMVDFKTDELRDESELLEDGALQAGAVNHSPRDTRRDFVLSEL